MTPTVPCPIHKYATGTLTCGHQEGDGDRGCIECPLLEQTLLETASVYSWLCPFCLSKVHRTRPDLEGRRGEVFGYYGEGECELCGYRSYLLTLVVWQP